MGDEQQERVHGSFLPGGGSDDSGADAGNGPAEGDPPLILRGGKVNPEAIELAYRRAAEAGTDDDSLFRVTFELSRDLKCRLDKYLTSRITFMSRNQLQHLIATGGVTVNALHPGFVASSFGMNNGLLFRAALRLAMMVSAIDVDRGAETSVHLAQSPEVAGITGRYFVKRREANSSAASRDAAAQAALWQESLRLCGMSEEADAL